MQVDQNEADAGFFVMRSVISHLHPYSLPFSALLGCVEVVIQKVLVRFGRLARGWFSAWLE